MEALSLQLIAQWAKNFTVGDDDVDFIVNLLLDEETPLTIHQISRLLVERRLSEEAAALEEQYKDALVYNPADSYDVGQKLIFPAFAFEQATVQAVRAGDNPEYGDFSVIQVTFKDGQQREFAAALAQPHQLNEAAASGVGALVGNEFSADDILQYADEEIIDIVEEALEANDTLIRLAKHWFPRDLVLDVDEGHLNLAEAVLELSEGEPLQTPDIVKQIGGISNNSPLDLQVFSLNGAMNRDSRFDEVGPVGKVLWYLVRNEPEAVQQVPPMLHYHPIDFDPSVVTGEARDLVHEIADELSDLPVQRGITEGTLTLIYPHRRVGTLPLNGNIRALFPYAQRTSKIYITLVDAADGEEFIGWVVPGARYIYGLLPLYTKHAIPIGAYVHVQQADTPDRVVIRFDTHRARTEWLPIFVPKGEQIGFENTRRAIGADFDPLLILGIDDLQAVDDLVATWNGQRRTLVALLRAIIPELCRLTPQATAHAKTIYSAVNVVRRCPPGVILAMLRTNPDFVDVGGNYWQLADN